MPPAGEMSRLHALLLLLLLCVGLTLSSGETVDSGANKNYCFEMKEKYKIVPGESFGSLPNALHNEYLAAKCFRHFCEPNPMGGRGKFVCVPLPGVHWNNDRG